MKQLVDYQAIIVDLDGTLYLSVLTLNLQKEAQASFALHLRLFQALAVRLTCAWNTNVGVPCAH